MYESSCSTKYVKSEENEGKFLADTSCEKLPIEICGAGCNYVDGDEECHDKVITTIVNVPEARLGCLFCNTFHISRLPHGFYSGGKWGSFLFSLKYRV